MPTHQLRHNVHKISLIMPCLLRPEQNRKCSNRTLLLLFQFHLHPLLLFQTLFQIVHIFPHRMLKTATLHTISGMSNNTDNRLYWAWQIQIPRLRWTIARLCHRHEQSVTWSQAHWYARARHWVTTLLLLLRHCVHRAEVAKVNLVTRQQYQLTPSTHAMIHWMLLTDISKLKPSHYWIKSTYRHR